MLREISPLGIRHGVKRPRSPAEVRTPGPVRLVIQTVATNAPGVGRIGLTVHDLKGSPGIRRVAEVFIAGGASYASGEDRGSRGAARGWSSGRQAPEEAASGFFDGVQLSAGYAILLFDVLPRVQGGRSPVPVDANVAAGCTVTTVQIHLGRDVHLSCTRRFSLISGKSMEDAWQFD